MRLKHISCHRATCLNSCFTAVNYSAATDCSVAGGGLGGIIASVSFRQQDAANGYRPGLWTTVAAQLTICLVVAILMMYFKNQNNKAKRGEKILEGHERGSCSLHNW